MYYVPKKSTYQSNIGNMFNDFFKQETLAKWATVPAVNVRETVENFYLEVAAPGMSKEDFKIEINENILKIWSEKKQESSEKTEAVENAPRYTRQEFSYQAFQRSFTLPKNTENDQVSATYTNGILEITIPKKEELKLKKSVTVL